VAPPRLHTVRYAAVLASMSKHSRPGVVPEVPEKQAASAVVDSDARASQPRRCRYCPDFYCGDHRGMLPGR